MADVHRILTSANGPLEVTNIIGTAGAQSTFQGLPLGTSDGTVTGTLGVKVIQAGIAVGSAAGATVSSSAALESGRVLKNSPGTLISLIGYNSSASAQFIQLHNSASVPINGNIPIVSITVPAASNFSIDVPLTGLPFAVGISVCNSSTVATKTIGSADCFFTGTVK